MSFLGPQRTTRILTFTVMALVVGATVTAAADRPIAAERLQMKRSRSTTKIKFVSKDASVLFPDLGGPDDPVLNGAVLEIIPRTDRTMTVPIDAGVGKPGWTVKDPPHASLKFVLGSLKVVLKQGRGITFSFDSGLLLRREGFEAVAIRLTTGTLRNCAIFGPDTIQRDDWQAFVAKNAVAPSIVDCSDASLGLPNCDVSAAPTCGGACAGDGVCTAEYGFHCRCVSPSAPCGDTHPTCNGTCPVGDECLPAHANATACACVPAGSTPCFETGAPTCGGACASGDVCRPAFFGCYCKPPGACGAGGYDCPAGYTCIADFGHFFCTPMPCDGIYPTCGGPCGDGGECQPAARDTSHGCVCAVPAPCDASCGGLTCPSGEVCSVDFGGAPCGCGAP